MNSFQSQISMNFICVTHITIVPDGEVGQQAFAVRSHKPGTTARFARVTASERSGRL
jgi:hypothetical protein